MSKQLNPLLVTCHEVLQTASKIRVKKERVAFLQAHSALHIRNVLRGAFDDSIQWDLPEGKPPYEMSSDGFRHMRRTTDQLKYFVVGGPGENMAMAKKQKIFISMLENLPPEDADVIIAMKDKKLHELYPGITLEIVNQAFPKLIRKQPGK